MSQIYYRLQQYFYYYYALNLKKNVIQTYQRNYFSDKLNIYKLLIRFLPFFCLYFFADHYKGPASNHTQINVLYIKNAT